MTTSESMVQPADRRTPEKRTSLPLFYGALEPLNSGQHENLSVASVANYGFAAAASFIPVLVSELAPAQAHYPIVFTAGDNSVPVALVGTPQGGNRFVNEAGKWAHNTYVPAYARRYPFALVRQSAESETMTLCIDTGGENVAKVPGKGNLFVDGEPSQITLSALKFCEEFEAAARQTEDAMAELVCAKLLIDGQAQVQKDGQPSATFRGFKIISEDKLRGLAGYEVSKLIKSGAMALVYAHLFSIRHMERIFGDKVQDDEASRSIEAGVPENGKEPAHEMAQ